MTNISVSVVDPSKTQHRSIRLPSDVPAGQLLETVLQEMGVPSYDSDGERVHYYLLAQQQNAISRRLESERTLEEQGVLEGTVLELRPSRITIGLLNPTATTQFTMVLPNDVPVKQLTGPIANEMRLQEIPLLRHRLNFVAEDGTLLPLNGVKTLEENEVQDGDLLQLSVGIIAEEPQFLTNNAQTTKPALRNLPSESDILTSKLSDRLDKHLTKREQIISEQTEILQLILNRMDALDHVIEQQNRRIESLELGRYIPPPDAKMPDDLDNEEGCHNPEYIDFDLTFSAQVPEYSVVAQWMNDDQSIQVNEIASMLITLDELELDYFRGMGLVSRGASRTIALARKLGDHLFRSIFINRIRDTFRSCQIYAGHERCVRIRLNFEKAVDLINYPWEFLWNEDDQFMGRTHRITIARCFSMTRPEVPLILQSSLRMLVVTASPVGFPPLDINKETENLNYGLGHLAQRKVLQIDRLDHATSATLRKKCQNFRPHIIHYIGHGYISSDGESYLALESANGDCDTLDGERLHACLTSGNGHIKLVVLNTCRGARAKAKDPFAGVAMQLARYQMAAIVAMQHEIHDQTAINFSREFYRKLGAGCSLYSAMTEARMALYIDHKADIEWAIPVLYTRSPDGVIFKTK